MTGFLGLLTVLAVLAAVVLFFRSGSAESARAAAVDRANELEKRLGAIQGDLGNAKEDLKRKGAALEDARERAARAKKKEARELKGPAVAQGATPPDPVMMSRYAAAVESAERRAAAAERELDAKLAVARTEAVREVEHKMEELKGQLARATAKKEERAEKPAEPTHVPGVRIDVVNLDKPVLEELRRFYKRAVNAEKLCALSDQTLDLVKDKLEETQKRYYAVCRELSLAAVNSQKPQELSDAEAQKLAMDLVNASEEATARRQTLKGTPRRLMRPAAAPPPGSEEPGRPGQRRQRPFQRRNRGDRPSGGAQRNNGNTGTKDSGVTTATAAAPSNGPVTAG